MSRSLQDRRWQWGVATVVGMSLVSGYLWWAGRLSRAVDRIVSVQGSQSLAAQAERIPDAWVPDLIAEMVRDDTGMESLRISVQSRMPSTWIPHSFRYPGAFLRRDRALVALSSGRDTGEVLRVLESAYPAAQPSGAQWLVTAYEMMSAPDDPGRRSLFLVASRNPDPQVRVAAVALVAGKPDPSGKGDRKGGGVRDRLRELRDDQVSVVREAAGRALAERLDE